MSNAYIFFGKPGSGKGTQADLVKKHLESQGRQVVYIETGALFRNFVTQESNSFAGKRTAEIIDQGKLMPPFFPIYAWASVLIKNYSGTEDIIFDGVARKMEEASILDSALDFFQVSKRTVFHVHITDQTAIERLAMRNQGRADDSDTAKMQTRLDLYTNNVLPVFDLFRGKEAYTFAEINGEETVEGVFGQIEGYLS